MTFSHCGNKGNFDIIAYVALYRQLQRRDMMRKTIGTKKALPKTRKSQELVEKYISLGFSHDDAQDAELRAGSTAPFAPISFLPHIDYTVSSVIGG